MRGITKKQVAYSVVENQRFYGLQWERSLITIMQQAGITAVRTGSFRKQDMTRRKQQSLAKQRSGIIFIFSGIIRILRMSFSPKNGIHVV